MRRIASICIKYLIGIISVIGVTLACVFAQRDGYSHWTKRLLYFTQQSNIWIGVVCLILAISLTIGLIKKKENAQKYLYILKYAFTVSITITGIIFCAILAPFAGDGYNSWSFSSIATHVIVPILSIADFFVDEKEMVFSRKHMLICLIPPFLYFIFASILSLLNVDFGRGVPYPYIFLDYHSEAGLFGYIKGSPPVLGTAYWIIFIFFLVLFLSWMYYKLHPATRKDRKTRKKTQINKGEKE